MSSALNQIESVVIDKLKLIDGAIHTWPGSSIDYKYYTTTGRVNDRDNTISVIANKLAINVDYEVNIMDDEMYESQSGANCQRFRAAVEIIASPRNDEIGISKNLINAKMNDVLSDLKYLFNRNETLNNLCFYFQYSSSRREYTNTNDMINSGKLILTYIVDYGSHFTNPDIINNNNFI